MHSGPAAPIDCSGDPIPGPASRPSAQRAAVRPVSSAEVTFRVLILEGEDSSDQLLIEAIRAEIPDADILRTAGVLGALALSGLYDFDLLIIEVPLTAELQHELLHSFHEHNPDAEVVIAGDAPESDEDADFPLIHSLPAPINPIEFIEVVRACRERILGPAVADDAEEDGHFVVVLSRHTPVEVVQLKCLSGATTALDFIRRNGPGGRIWFERGEVIHAETGGLHGIRALVEMINWPGGSIVEISVGPPDSRTIAVPWATLLMQAVQTGDELRANL